MDVILQQLIEYFDKPSKPNPDIRLRHSLQKKLGKYDKAGYFRSTQLIVYLQITNYNSLVMDQYGIKLDRIHYKLAAEILVFIEGKLSVLEREVEKQKYLMGF